MKLSRPTMDACKPLLATFLFFVLLWVCYFAQFAYFPESGKTIDLRSPKTWLNEQRIADNRPGFEEPLVRRVSFRRSMQSLLAGFLVIAVTLGVCGVTGWWRLLEVALLTVFIALPWAVLWWTYTMPDGKHVLEFRIYPVAWSYVMGGMTVYCISTRIGSRWFASRVDDLFAQKRSPLLYAMTGLLVLAAIQALIVDAKLPAPVDADTPLDWKKWVMSLSVVGWLDGIVMLAWSRTESARGEPASG